MGINVKNRKNQKTTWLYPDVHDLCREVSGITCVPIETLVNKALWVYLKSTPIEKILTDLVAINKTDLEKKMGETIAKSKQAA